MPFWFVKFEPRGCSSILVRRCLVSKASSPIPPPRVRPGSRSLITPIPPRIQFEAEYRVKPSFCSVGILQLKKFVEYIGILLGENLVFNHWGIL